MMQRIAETVPRRPDTEFGFDDPVREEATLHIFDARSKMAAFGNKASVPVSSPRVDRRIRIREPGTLPFRVAAVLRYCQHTLCARVVPAAAGDVHGFQVRREERKWRVRRTIRSVKWHAQLDKTEWLYHIVCLLKSANMMVESVRVSFQKLNKISQ